MLPLASDEDVHGDIIDGLRLRVPGIDLVRVIDAGMGGRHDRDVLDWAAREGRVLISQDQNTLVGFAYERVNNGLPMPGVLMRGSATIGEAIDALELVVTIGVPEDFRDQVRYLGGPI